ncbi:hypothetical protein FZEAL_2096 [Fusarium zealandicum]|uniref:Uncharacterized protein n=1 Tax=Fusarium zealandicum TaxID=1053134 RepID=A0A8H4URZ3_9HYPO|nr:hypothetical protein FZEAL_2096 [Fusarium zealandicum]
MMSRRSHRSKSLPMGPAPKKSFFATISRRFSLSAILRPNSHRVADEEDVKIFCPQPRPEPPTPTTQSRFSRRASRFWSVSSANYFEDNSTAPSTSPSAYEGSAYVPRHAAADFSKTASNRLTVMAEADETTLCSYNCKTNRNTNYINLDDEEQLDDEDASRHHEEALAALTASGRSHSFVTSSDGSTSDREGNDYSLFLAQATAGHDTPSQSSAAAWAEMEQRAALASRRTSGADPLIGRHSAYLGVRGSMSGSSRPVSSVAMSIAEYIRPSYAGKAW